VRCHCGHWAVTFSGMLLWTLQIITIILNDRLDHCKASGRPPLIRRSIDNRLHTSASRSESALVIASDGVFQEVSSKHSKSKVGQAPPGRTTRAPIALTTTAPSTALISTMPPGAFEEIEAHRLAATTVPFWFSTTMWNQATTAFPQAANQATSQDADQVTLSEQFRPLIKLVAIVAGVMNFLCCMQRLALLHLNTSSDMNAATPTPSRKTIADTVGTEAWQKRRNTKMVRAVNKIGGLRGLSNSRNKSPPRTDMEPPKPPETVQAEQADTVPK